MRQVGFYSKEAFLYQRKVKYDEGKGGNTSQKCLHPFVAMFVGALSLDVKT